jgi:hypothetical protein
MNKPLLSLYGIEWWERGYGLKMRICCTHCVPQNRSRVHCAYYLPQHQEQSRLYLLCITELEQIALYFNCILLSTASIRSRLLQSVLQHKEQSALCGYSASRAECAVLKRVLVLTVLKYVSGFPVPCRDVTEQTLPGL